MAEEEQIYSSVVESVDQGAQVGPSDPRWCTAGAGLLPSVPYCHTATTASTAGVGLLPYGSPRKLTEQQINPAKHTLRN